jgi:alkyl hydroperoxide reductase subunit D
MLVDFISTIKPAIPDYAKDVRLNLDAVLTRSSLTTEQASGVALAAAFALRYQPLFQLLKQHGELSETELNGVLTASSIMGMNNVWYSYLDMADSSELKTQRAELRMNAYATHGGIAKTHFEMYALAASIIGKCHFCVASHRQTLEQEGFSVTQIRDIGRIVATIQATANILNAENFIIS